MQGAALKLTALAASLAVGFVVLLQTQQGLNSPPSSANSPDVTVELSPESAAALEQSAELATSPDGVDSPFFERSAESEPAQTATSWPPGNATAASASVAAPDPFLAHSAEAAAPQAPPSAEPGGFPGLAAASPLNNANTSNPAPPTMADTPAAADPFADFAAALNNGVQQAQQNASEMVKQTVEVAESRADEVIQQVSGEIETVETKIQQAADSVEANVTPIPNQLSDEAASFIQAAANSLTPAMESPAARDAAPIPTLGLAQNFPPADFGPAASAAPTATSPSTPAAPGQFPGTATDDQAPSGLPRPIDVGSDRETEPGKPRFNTFPAGNSDAPLISFPPADAESVGKPAPVAEMESPTPPSGFPETPANDAPANPFGASAPANEPEPAPAAEKPFFDEFSGSPPATEATVDEPYRLVPEFNTASPAEMQDKNATQPDAAVEKPAEQTPPVVKEPETEAPTPAGFPAVEPQKMRPMPPETSNPFGFSTESEPAPAEPLPATAPGFPSAPANAPEPANVPSTGAEFPTLDDPAPTLPAMEPAPTPPVNPFGAPLPAEEPNPLPTTAEREPAPLGSPVSPVEKREPAAFPGLDAGPLELTPAPANPAPAPAQNMQPVETGTPAPSVTSQPVESSTVVEEELIGSAKLDNMSVENVQQPRVELYKSAPENAVLGQPLIYSIEVVNTGDVPVKEVRVEDQFPAGTKLTGTIPRAELVEERLVWKFAELKPEERQKILVRVVPVEAGHVGSISTVSYKSVVAAQTLVTAPKLELNVNANTEEIALGETVQLTFRVANTGTGDATGIVLRNLIPQGLEHPAGNDLEYEIGTLKKGAAREITLALVAKQVGQHRNAASIRSESGLTASAETAVSVIPAALELTHSGPTRRFLGHSTKYITTIKNPSSQPHRNVQVRVNLPAGWEFQSASAEGLFNRPEQQVNWQIAELAAGESRELELQVKPQKIGEYELQWTANSAAGHTAELTNAVRVDGFASLAVRVPDARGPVAVGERTSLRFKIVNRGSAPATEVNILCTIPQQLTYLSAKGPGQAELVGNQLRFTPLAKLGAGQEISFDLVLTAAQAGDARVICEVNADQTTTPIKIEEQVVVYGE